MPLLTASSPILLTPLVQQPLAEPEPIDPDLTNGTQDSTDGPQAGGDATNPTPENGTDQSVATAAPSGGSALATASAENLLLSRSALSLDLMSLLGVSDDAAARRMAEIAIERLRITELIDSIASARTALEGKGFASGGVPVEEATDPAIVMPLGEAATERLDRFA